MRNKKHLQRVSVVLVALLSLALLGFSSGGANCTSTDGISIQTWNLVGSGKFCTWEANSSKYKDYVELGTYEWNAYRSTFRKYGGSWTTIHLSVSDVNKPNVDWGGETSALGYMRLNDAFMKSETIKLVIPMHELGHALGLAHNRSTDVMYANNNSVVTLSKNDKASYDAAYERY